MIARLIAAILGLGAAATATPPFADPARLYDPAWELLFPEDFTVTQPHLDLIRSLRLDWAGYEAGAPQADLANPWVLPSRQQFATVLGTQDEAGQIDVALQMVAAITVFFRHAEIAPGRYTTSNVPLAALWSAAGIPGSAPAAFDLTEELIALARALAWQWPHEDEVDTALSAGAIPGPAVDAKRPYGDMSFYALDVHRVLDWPVESRTADGYIALSEAQVDAASRLHRLMLPVAQIFVEHARLAAGTGF